MNPIGSYLNYMNLTIPSTKCLNLIGPRARSLTPIGLITHGITSIGSRTQCMNTMGSRTKCLNPIGPRTRSLTPIGPLTWYVPLPLVLAAEAGDPAGNEHHEGGGHCAHDEQQLEVDLAVLAGEPRVTITRHLHQIYVYMYVYKDLDC